MKERINLEIIIPEAVRIAKDFFGRCFDETEEK